jgi:hypothetical protein
MSVRHFVSSVVADFQDQLSVLVEGANRGELDDSSFSMFIAGLKDMLANTGRTILTDFIAANEERGDVFEHRGVRHRFKQLSTKEWLSPFGILKVDRRYYQPDKGGDGVAPLDLKCGMTGRYMTLDVEEVSAFASAQLSPGTARQLLGKLLPHAPSEKAIRRVIAEVGQVADDSWDQIQDHVEEQAALPDGEVLVVSADGVIVPMREAGIKPGRPPQRPGLRKGNQTPTAWREAAVGTVSIYRPGTEDKKHERLGTRYFGG